MILAIDKQTAHWSITLNRPDKLNALSAEMVEALIDALDAAAAAQVAAVTLQGEGRCFSAGFDMSEVERHSEGDLLLRFVRIEQLLQRVAGAPFHTIALAHGRNFGAGVDLIAACNLRVAAPGTTFRMPGLQFGLVLGSARLARIVGVREAQRLLETSATFDVERALRNGFIEQVAAPEQFGQVRAEAVARATALPAASRAQLLAVLRAPELAQADAELAALVRSAAVPGLKQRIDAYRHPAGAGQAGTASAPTQRS
ncbi:enoyl-CoA hydratase/isomerase family protein [Pandoraea sp.]|uniref:enoyl-CoA hydratase/isomerase family protein n=1 Tax=Pandoraea sp. TaxID=1883445 RepID=UPI001221DC8C|nr:enoyl-CoA hydratase/isomerase family protein [Pandoraea sp.]TAL53358.1 MAG: enoyl-CoA hydratase/isomerase family protein [Pandoraea sp.]TAM20448.1 MAG: enoyl-CoA hydratase/isomerase family protein [Pandoraea sp.]